MEFLSQCAIKALHARLWSFFGRKGHKNNLNNTKRTSTVVYFNLGRRQKYIFEYICIFALMQEAMKTCKKKLVLQCYKALVMFVAPFIGFPRKIDIFGAFAQKCRQCNFPNIKSNYSSNGNSKSVIRTQSP